MTAHVLAGQPACAATKVDHLSWRALSQHGLVPWRWHAGRAAIGHVRSEAMLSLRREFGDVPDPAQRRAV
jgi:hypothetical protein